MFTGIIESLGKIINLRSEGENLHITVESDFTNELQIDQSVAHNGVCLTVVDIRENSYVITAIQETLQKTTLNSLRVGDMVNLERAMKLGARLDGHIVQGHVDETGRCTAIEEADGSWYFTFEHNPEHGNVTIEKGSITINGVSLTVVNSKINEFSVAIIPYTYAHTTFHTLDIGATVNLEFDVIGKYVQKLTQHLG